MKVASAGSVLVMTLVFFVVFVVIMGAWLRFATRQNNAVVGQEQEEQSFHISEAGINWVQHILNSGVCTPDDLNTDQPVIESVVDGTTPDLAELGKYHLLFEILSSTLTRVTAHGYDRNVASECQLIVATLESFQGDQGTRYRVQSWDHKSTVTCGAAPTSIEPPTCIGATPTPTPTPTATPTATPTPTPTTTPPPSTIFVTSSRHTSDLNGLTGANQICKDRADEASLPNSTNFIAVLSDFDTHARDNINPPGEIYRVDGVRVASSEADLWDGSIENPINRDENGTEVVEDFVAEADTVWTGTSTTGVGVFISGSSFCSSWDALPPQYVTAGS